MAAPSFSGNWKRIQSETARYERLATECRTLSPENMKLLAEVLMIRLFFLMENSMSSCAAKCIMGASYLDGTQSKPLVRVASIRKAYDEMCAHGRGNRRIRYLKWSQEPVIRDNLVHTLDSTDPFFGAVAAFSTRLEEMRVVRNHIAHGTPDTRRKFRAVITQYYGGNRNGVTPGVLLLSSKLGGRPVLERYIAEVRVFLRGLFRA